ncbi:hypothetical protein CAP35_13085 [Chitinophagaceae bacterium IBVUCB1]|nr:hypothetical protein CAP35_13085 [Chitinophagaceae bacterium IBVUCB1]
MKNTIIPALMLYAFSANAQTFNSFDINTSGDSNPDNFVIGNKITFIANNGTNGREPFVTSTTLFYPAMTLDINNAGNCDCSNMIYMNNAVYMKATDNGTTGSELYKIDLSTPGNTTTLLQDINTGALGANITYACVSNGKVFFQAEAPSLLSELWSTDGTNTNNVADLCTPSCSSSPKYMTNFNNKVYFSARYDASSGTELCSSDGSTISLVKDIKAGVQSSSPQNFKALGTSKLFFLVEEGFGLRLAVTDGTNAGTVLLKDINTANANLGGVENLNGWGELNGKVYFRADNGTDGDELWVSDGTDAGTQMVKNINPTGSSNPSDFCEFYGKLYFSADNGTNGRELWVTDGTDAGTTMYKDIHPTGSSNPSLMVQNNNRLYFKAQETDNNYQLFEFQLAPGSTYVKAITPANATKTNPLGNTGQLASSNSNKTIYYSANYNSIGQEVWTMSNPVGVSVTSISLPVSFSLYPNPNKGTFTLQMDNANFTTASLMVYDVVGKLVHQQAITSRTQTIALQQPAGIYMAKLQIGDAVLTRQVVIE